MNALIVLRFIQSYDSGSQRKSLRKHVSLPEPKLWAFASLSAAKIIPGPAMSGLHMLLRVGLEPKITEVTVKGLSISLLVNNAKLQKEPILHHERIFHVGHRILNKKTLFTDNPN